MLQCVAPCFKRAFVSCWNCVSREFCDHFESLSEALSHRYLELKMLQLYEGKVVTPPVHSFAPLTVLSTHAKITQPHLK